MRNYGTRITVPGEFRQESSGDSIRNCRLHARGSPGPEFSYTRTIWHHRPMTSILVPRRSGSRLRGHVSTCRPLGQHIEFTPHITTDRGDTLSTLSPFVGNRPRTCVDPAAAGVSHCEQVSPGRFGEGSSTPDSNGAQYRPPFPAAARLASPFVTFRQSNRPDNSQTRRGIRNCGDGVDGALARGYDFGAGSVCRLSKAFKYGSARQTGRIGYSKLSTASPLSPPSLESVPL
jgi:hypothetical protein